MQQSRIGWAKECDFVKICVRHATLMNMAVNVACCTCCILVFCRIKQKYECDFVDSYCWFQILGCG